MIVRLRNGDTDDASGDDEAGGMRLVRLMRLG
jgi:hypothetical protein